MPAKKDPRLARAGVSGYNKPKRTPSHPTKKFVVVAKEGDKIKTIRFGDARMTSTVFIRTSTSHKLLLPFLARPVPCG